MKTPGDITDVNNDGLTPGDTLAYTFTVTNTGNLTLSAVTVSDDKVANIVCVATTLAPAASTTCTGDQYILTQEDISAGQVDNEATARGTPTVGPEVEATATATKLLPDLSLLTIEKLNMQHTDADGNGFVSPGDTLAYTITATNLGNTELTNVTVTDNRITPDRAVCAALAPAATCVLTGSLTVTVR